MAALSDTGAWQTRSGRPGNPDGEHELEHHEDAVRLLDRTARETVPPLDRLETALQPWVAFAIMPVFAPANAGVHLNLPALADPVASGVAAVLGSTLLGWFLKKAELATNGG